MTIVQLKRDRSSSVWDSLIKESFLYKVGKSKAKSRLVQPELDPKAAFSLFLDQNPPHVKCTKKKCKEDLYCLAHLQNKNWNVETVDDNDLDDPSLKKSDKVGIKNLGATCYLNTLLQIWFYNQSFRKIIYSYVPASNRTQNIVMVLQCLFAQMQSSKAPYIDAKPLIEMLDLRPHIQQDSLEFSKLLGSYLEAVLSASQSQSGGVSSSSDHPSSSSLLKKFSEEYKGIFQYTIECCRCHTKTFREAEFAELEVSIPSNGGSLTEAVFESLSAEMLTGANKYKCSHCQSEQDAIRNTDLKLIPPYLQIQVNRFVFDRKTMSKKKSNKSISFPASIDISRFSSSKESGRSSTSSSTKNKEKWYDLCAVLLHRGTNANSGHYICRVFDQESGQWLNCDDESVSIMDPPNFQLKSHYSSKDGGDTASSSVTSNLTPQQDLEDSDVVEITPSAGTKTNGSSNDFSSTSAYMLCYRARKPLVPYPAVPALLVESVEQKNAVEEKDLAEQEKKEFELNNRITELRTSFEELYSCWQGNQHTPKDQLVFLSSESLFKAVKQVTGGLFKDVNESLVDPYSVNIRSSEIKCSHEKLDPSSFGQFKAVTVEGFNKLKSIGFEIPEILTFQDWCEECFHDTLRNQIETALHVQDLEVYRKNRRSKECYAISKKWFSEWKKKIPFDTGDVPDPMEEVFKSDVLCEHGCFATDDSKLAFLFKDVYTIIQARYDYRLAFEKSDERCSVCIVADQRMLLDEDEQDEKMVSILDLKRLTTATKALHLKTDCVYYLVPKTFVDAWRSYAKSTTRQDTPVLETSSLLCDSHNKVFCRLPSHCVAASKSKASSVDSVLVDEDEWDSLRRLCGAAPPIMLVARGRAVDEGEEKFKLVNGKLYPKEDGSSSVVHFFETTPEFCDECQEAEELNYRSGFIYVVKRADTTKSSGGNPSSSKSIASAGDSSDIIEIPSEGGLRQTTIDGSSSRPNKRARTGRSLQKKRERIPLSVQPDLTVRTLKESLVTKYHVPPIYQKLFFSGREISDDNLTMRELKIKPGAELEIEIFDQDACDANGYDDDYEGSREFGFTGTKLTGSIPIGNEIWECSVCTLLNDANAKFCNAFFSGNSHPELAEMICGHLSIPVGRSTLKKFSNRETSVMIGETVRDLDVFIIQSSCGNVNDMFIELLIMLSACRTASARKITAVIPCFPYARQSENNYSDEAHGPPKKAASSLAHSRDSSVAKTVAFTSEPASDSAANTYVLDGGFTDPGSPRPEKMMPTTPDSKSLSKNPNSSLPPQSPSASLENARKRLSSISTSQPNIAITSLTPPRPQKGGEEVGKNGGGNHAYKRWKARPGTLIANTLMAAGCDHVITMDLHDPQFQGFFDIPVDNLYSHPLIIKYIKEKIPNYRDAVIVSPDAGGAKRATLIADKLQMDFALIHKERLHHGPRGSEMMLVGDVTSKFCIIIDDMSDTAETICSASHVLVEKGATKVVAIITHGILSGDALERINKSPLTEVIVSNSVPQGEHKDKSSKIRVMDVSVIFAEAIRRIHNGESVSFLADVVPY